MLLLARREVEQQVPHRQPGLCPRPQRLTRRITVHHQHPSVEGRQLEGGAARGVDGQEQAVRPRLASRRLRVDGQVRRQTRRRVAAQCHLDDAAPPPVAAPFREIGDLAVEERVELARRRVADDRVRHGRLPARQGTVQPGAREGRGQLRVRARQVQVTGPHRARDALQCGLTTLAESLCPCGGRSRQPLLAARLVRQRHADVLPDGQVLLELGGRNASCRLRPAPAVRPAAAGRGPWRLASRLRRAGRRRIASSEPRPASPPRAGPG